ncbi:unnamed protein product [Ilex paraguariensis]|uniref:RHOMBOID-like protein n=1 Tax=Ilex paraguariensis TaxID=185542 RepID=A0ABC8TZQ7_9AQUA
MLAEVVVYQLEFTSFNFAFTRADWKNWELLNGTRCSVSSPMPPIDISVGLALLVGVIYLLSGLGGSILSSLFIERSISVGASGALFGLLGAMLSELLTNWTIYANKAGALFTLVVIILINLAIGILPHVDNFAHIGGFLTGFLLGFVLLLRPQFGWLERQHLPADARMKSKYTIYQLVFLLVSLILLIAGFTLGLVMVFRGENANDHCSWCHYLSCVPTSRWNCNN